jgi:hypothetical protein
VRVNRPNLFIVGAPKCGTTAWVQYLSRRSDVYFCEPKEPHFFNTDMPGFRWYKTEGDYLALFQGVEGKKYCGEASVMYLYSREAAANIARFAPDAKLLAFVRHHGSFIASYHQQLLYNRDESEANLAKAWALSGNRQALDLPKHCRDERLIDYKSVGAFSEQIERYLDHFDRQQLKIIEFESWTVDPRRTYLEILAFLQLEDDGMVDFERVNAAHRHRFQSLADLTQRPSPQLRTLLSALRKLPGLRDWRPGRVLRRLNRAEGYSQAVSADLLAGNRLSSTSKTRCV